MHAREVDAGLEDIGVARQRLRREQAAVRQAPDADAVRDRRPDATAGTCRRRARPGTRRCRRRGVRRRAERPAVADAAAIVHRQHDVALAREPLIDAVRPVIELHVVVAEQHLPHGPAVHEDDRRPLLARLDVLRQEQLVVDLEPVGRLRDHDLRLHVRVGRETRARRRIDDPLRGPHRLAPDPLPLSRASARRFASLRGHSRSSCQTPSDCGMFQPALSVASIFPDASGAGYVSMPSPVVTWRGVATRDRHGPDVPALDVLGVGAVVERLRSSARAQPTSDPRSGRRSSSAARAADRYLTG